MELMMKNNLDVFVFGVAIGISLVLLVIFSPESNNSKYLKAKEDCELTLPRDKQCIIIGVPDTK